MRDFVLARKKMVEEQLERRGIRDDRVLAAMREVPRHLFVAEAMQGEAYDDNPLPIGEGQTISQPYMVGVMTELLQLHGTEIVLEIGTGSGYQAAVLSKLCKWVYTVERIQSLSEHAELIMKNHGYTNITFIVGDGTEGWPAADPYDGIIVTAGAPRIPDTFIKQLRLGGRLVIPVGDRFSQTLKKVTKTEEGTAIENHTGCRFVDLIGRWGWFVA
jgi:protein-L-isoaspartate(D-aspartate) O-methyltransferase